MNNENIIVIGVGITLITISNILGHFIPPSSILLTPFLLPTIIIGLNHKLYRLSFTGAVTYGFGLLLFNDLFVRLYAGGIHDQQGKGFIFLFFGIAFILVLMLLILESFTIIDRKSEPQYFKKAMSNLATVATLAFLTGTFYYRLIADI